MVKVHSIAWHDEAWEVRFDIKEGVYNLTGYPVRMTHLGRSEVAGLEDDLTAVAAGLLQRHMRRGAVPPHAVVINWGRVMSLSQGGPPELAQAIDRITRGRGEPVASAVSDQF